MRSSGMLCGRMLLWLLLELRLVLLGVDFEAHLVQAYRHVARQGATDELWALAQLQILICE